MSIATKLETDTIIYMKVIRHAGVDSRMFTLDDKACQQITLRIISFTSMQRFTHYD